MRKCSLQWKVNLSLYVWRCIYIQNFSQKWTDKKDVDLCDFENDSENDSQNNKTEKECKTNMYKYRLALGNQSFLLRGRLLAMWALCSNRPANVSVSVKQVLHKLWHHNYEKSLKIY